MVASPRIHGEGNKLPTVLFLIAEDWNVVSHFSPVIREARANGLDVVVATRVARHQAEIEGLGARVIPINIDPRTPSTTRNSALILALASLVRRERPDIVYCVTIRMCVIGGIAARIAGARNLILAPTGLGHIWIVDGMRHRLVRGVTRNVLARILPLGCRTRYLFENDEDPREIGLDERRHQFSIIGGAGVDPVEFPVTVEPASGPIKVAVVARMTRQKGIAESIAAIKAARDKGTAIELHLFGDPDKANPSSLDAAGLQRMAAANPGVTWHGGVADVARIWREHHIAMLLSYREGLPRSLIEAAACGRPIVTTDVVGCRTIVRNNIEGLLVPLGDIDAAATALMKLAGDAQLRATLGANARARFEAKFTEAAVRETVGKLYRELIGDEKPSGSKRPVGST